MNEARACAGQANIFMVENQYQKLCTLSTTLSKLRNSSVIAIETIYLNAIRRSLELTKLKALTHA
jgi:hypothetical protein